MRGSCRGFGWRRGTRSGGRAWGKIPGWPRSPASLLDAPDHLAQGLDLALVGGLLAFGFLQQFQDEFHLVEGIAQIVDDQFHVGDGLPK